MDQSNLILIPEEFENPDLLVESSKPIEQSQKTQECQLLLTECVIISVLRFVKSIIDRIYEDELPSNLKTRKRTATRKASQVSQDTSSSEKEADEDLFFEEKFYLDENKEFCLYLKIMPNERFLKFYKSF